MSSFTELLAEIQHDCALEHVPTDKISMLARLCGAAEVDRLICELDILDDADLENDAGDLGDEYWRLRAAYSQALAEAGEPAIEPLLRALDSKNPQTRAYAARALGLMGAHRALSPIVTMLAEESNDVMCMQLLEALGGPRNEQAVEVLLPYLRTPQGVQNRGWLIRMAANALGRIGSEAVIQPLSEVLASDPDWFAQLGAAEGLRLIQHPSAAEALRRALKDDDAHVRAVAETDSR